MQGLTSAGLQGASLTPATNTGAQPLAGLATEFQMPEKNWLTPDLQSGTVDWSQFNALPTLDYSNILSRDYKRSPQGGVSSNIFQGPSFFNAYTQKSENIPTGITAQYFNEQNRANANAPVDVTGRFVINPSALQFKDTSVNAAIQALNDSAYSKLSKVASAELSDLRQNPGMGGIYAAMLSNRAPHDTSSWNKSPFEQAGLGDLDYTDVAGKTGMSVADLKKYYGQYSKAYDSLTDPVGANWQDLKNNTDVYNKSLLPGIRKYSGYDDAFFDNLNNMVSDGTRNSQKYLSPEYFTLHGTTRDVGGNHPYIGVTNPGVGTTNPYKLQDWADYLGANTDAINATPEQKAQAIQDMQTHASLMHAPVAEGGQFDLWKETGANPFQTTKVKGGKWVPVNSGYTNRLNIAQNDLGYNTSGQKNYQDAGFNAEDAWKSGFTFKKKKSFLGGLGPLLSIASFIPGPIGMGARIASVAQNAANGNILGAITGGASLVPGFNLAGSLGSKLSTATGLPASVANAVVSGGMGGLQALASHGDILKGALGGGLGSYARESLGNSLLANNVNPETAGIVAGAAGSALNAGINGAKGLPLALSTGTGALSGYNTGRAIRSKMKAR